MPQHYGSRIETARKAGYSDDEIVQYLAKTDPKMATAFRAGYSGGEILSHLTKTRGPAFTPQQAGLEPPEVQAQQYGRRAIESGEIARSQEYAEEVARTGGIKGRPILPPMVGLPALAVATGAERAVQRYGEGASPREALTSGAIAGGTTYVGGKTLPAIAGKISRIIPSTRRAGAALESVKAAAGDVQIDVSAVGNRALRIDQMAQRGGTMPKVIRNFIQRASDPGKEPITFTEARDFYSNATRLSADETKRLTPALRREVTRFRNELGQSLQWAAESTGKGKAYREAMREYHRAMVLKEKVPAVAKWIAKWGGLGTASLYALDKIFGPRN